MDKLIIGDAKRQAEGMIADIKGTLNALDIESLTPLTIAILGGRTPYMDTYEEQAPAGPRVCPELDPDRALSEIMAGLLIHDFTAGNVRVVNLLRSWSAVESTLHLLGRAACAWDEAQTNQTW
jgi:hypothetical protein